MTKEYVPEPHQFGWIFQHAQKHFASQIEQLEIELARHERFPNSPYYSNSLKGPQDRSERVQDCIRWIGIYQQIHGYCCQMRMLAMERSAEVGAADIGEMIRERLKPTKTVRQKRNAKT